MSAQFIASLFSNLMLVIGGFTIIFSFSLMFVNRKLRNRLTIVVIIGLLVFFGCATVTVTAQSIHKQQTHQSALLATNQQLQVNDRQLKQVRQQLRQSKRSNQKLLQRSFTLADQQIQLKAKMATLQTKVRLHDDN